MRMICEKTNGALFERTHTRRIFSPAKIIFPTCPIEISNRNVSARACALAPIFDRYLDLWKQQQQIQVIVRYFEPTSLTCLVEPWLRELGFSIFYGSILIKLYRILTEFQTRKAHRVCFRDKDQVVYLLAIVLIVIGYMSAWTALMVDGFLFGGQGSHDSSSSSISSGETVTVLDGATTLGNGVGGSTSTLSSTPVIFPEQAAQIGAGSGETALPATNVSSSGQAELFETYLGNDADSSASRFESTPTSSSGGSRKVVDQLAEYAPEQLRIFARNLDSFGELFSGLLEQSEPKYDESSESFVTTMRCRKLTWDYVTELSK